MGSSTGLEHSSPRELPSPTAMNTWISPPRRLESAGSHGSPDGELYGEEVHDMCQVMIDKAGWQIADEPWFFELYNCPCFTTLIRRRLSWITVCI